jgi:MFS family permease
MPVPLTRPPRNVRWATIVLVVSCLVIFFSGPGQTYGVSTFVDPMIADLGISRSLYSLTYSFGTMMSALSLAYIGRLIDRIGERRILAAATVGLAVALLFLSAAQGPLSLLIGFSLLRASGQGVLVLAAKTIIPHWFIRRRGFAFSIVGLAGALSLALFPLLHARTVDALGWRGAWRLDALMLMLILLPAVLIFLRNRPSDVGVDIEREEARNDMVPPRLDLEIHVAADEGMTTREAMRTPIFWAIVAAGLVPSLVVTGLAFNQVAIFTERGLPETLAATTFTVESIVQVLVTLGVGWYLDRYPVKHALVAGQIVLALAMVALFFAGGVWLSYAYAMLRGASSALWMIGADVAWPRFFGRRELGSIRGIGTSLGVVGAAIGPLPFGVAYDLTGSYSYAIGALLVLPVAAAVTMWVVRPPRRDTRPEWTVRKVGGHV